MAFFELYKRGQGVGARWVTASAIAAFCLFGLYELHDGLSFWETSIGSTGLQWRMVVVAAIAVACALLTALVVNGKKTTDFLIVTEAELRKVSWPTRRDLQRQTLIVVTVMFALGGIIFVADMLFSYLSRLLYL